MTHPNFHIKIFVVVYVGGGGGGLIWFGFCLFVCLFFGFLGFFFCFCFGFWFSLGGEVARAEGGYKGMGS